MSWKTEIAEGDVQVGATLVQAGTAWRLTYEGKCKGYHVHGNRSFANEGDARRHFQEEMQQRAGRTFPLVKWTLIP